MCFSLALSACQTTPEWIELNRDASPSFQQVQNQPKEFMKQVVLWGGVIVETRNQKESSMVTIVAYPLDDKGRPKTDGLSTGRFIAQIDGFIEPVVYADNREMTVLGPMHELMTQQVGDFPYPYPVIKAEQHILWPKKVVPAYRYPVPYWRDPWYYPYYPVYDPFYMPPYRYRDPQTIESDTAK